LKEADVQRCNHGLITICDATFPLIHKRIPSCASALYFGQEGIVHNFCKKLILQKNFKPIWIYAKNKNSFWIYSLPTTTHLTKTCKINGTSTTKDLVLTGSGILQEDANCQYFSEDFILLPVTDSYTNFTLTLGHVVAPDLPELISPEENHQLKEYSEEANSTLGTLESLMRRDTSSNQQKYVELGHLLQAVEQKRTLKNTNTWFIFNIVILLILIIVSLTLKYWKRLRGTSCTRMIPWRNGEQTSPGPAVRTLPQPRARECFPLSRIPEETDWEIAEEAHPLNLTVYSDAVPLQVDPARLTTSVSP
jgi:hypothetical protein